MRFPADKLTPSGGEIYAHLFENASTGVQRGVFWSITVKFAPIHYVGNDWTCSMTCEWIPWQIRDWNHLNGKTLDVKDEGEGVESSFYMATHHTASATSLRLTHRRNDIFQIAMSMLVDFKGYTGDDVEHNMRVVTEVDIPFRGLLVVPENLVPPLRSEPAVMDAASAFMDISKFARPKREGHAYILRPRVE